MSSLEAQYGNPINQDVVFYTLDGGNSTFTIKDLDVHNLKTLQQVIEFGTQLGAAVIVALILAIMTSRDKVRTMLFWSNMCSLIFVSIRAITNIIYFIGPFNEIFAYWTYSYEDVPDSAFANSIIASMSHLFLVMSIELSLVLQVRAIYATERKLLNIITYIGILFSLASAGLVFAENINNFQGLFTLRGGPEPPYLPRLAVAQTVMFAITITFFSLIFCVKLAVAIFKRRELGLTKFGPLQIIFIMACQTLVIPAICLIVEPFVKFEGLSYYAQAIIAYQLPLSSLWAASVVNAEFPSGINGGRLQGCKPRNKEATSNTAYSKGSSHKPSLSSNDSLKPFNDQELLVHVRRSFDITRPRT